MDLPLLLMAVRLLPLHIHNLLLDWFALHSVGLLQLFVCYKLSFVQLELIIRSDGSTCVQLGLHVRPIGRMHLQQLIEKRSELCGLERCWI